MWPSPTSALTGQISWFYFTHPFGKEHKESNHVERKKSKLEASNLEILLPVEPVSITDVVGTKLTIAYAGNASAK